VFARAYGAVTGLLPEPRSLSRFGLEAAMVVAGVLLLLGLGLGLVAVAQWGTQDFGALSGGKVMRLAIASVTAMLLGLQLAFGAFFLALLGMMRPAPRS
ncbi:MAG: glycosyltransferase family 2 protein, partial [Roseomonas sp.]|nr:glycosyltransferase family 2 protein [Roseomonas sp.]